MIADVDGPIGDHFVEFGPLAGEQSADGLFKARFIAGHRGHEAVGGLLRLPYLVFCGVDVAGFVDEFPEGDRGPTGLVAEPFPVSWEEGDFFGDDAEFGAAGFLWLFDLLWYREWVLIRAEVEFDEAAGVVVEDEDGGAFAAGEDEFGGGGDGGEVTGSDLAGAFEGGYGGHLFLVDLFYLDNINCVKAFGVGRYTVHDDL